MELEQLLKCSMEIGAQLLLNGAEIYRVEQSVLYICNAYQVDEVSAFALTGSLLVTVEKDGHSLTRSSRLVSCITDLNKVDKLTALSRYIAENSPSYTDIMERLENIKSEKPYPPLGQYLGAILLTSGSTLLFGGRFVEAVAVIPLALLVMFLIRFFRKFQGNNFFTNVLGGLVIGLGSTVISLIFTGIRPDMLVVGGIMLLVPGLALANAMRDIIMSDTISGMTRLAEALLTAIGIAVGIGVSMFLI